MALLGVRHAQQMQYRGCIANPQPQCLFHGYDQLVPSLGGAGTDKRDHLASPVALAMTLLKLSPDRVQASGPASSLTPLLQRRGTGHGSRLLIQHIEIVFQVEDLMTAPVATCVPRRHLVVVHDLYA